MYAGWSGERAQVREGDGGMDGWTDGRMTLEGMSLPPRFLQLECVVCHADHLRNDLIGDFKLHPLCRGRPWYVPIVFRVSAKM